jgi:pimeloyl-ACP methyl ester carboxylesterase
VVRETLQNVRMKLLARSSGTRLPMVSLAQTLPLYSENITSTLRSKQREETKMSAVEVKQTRVALSNGIVLNLKEWYLSSAACSAQNPVEVVFLHGLGDASCVWSAVASELGKQYRIAAVDLRGHGDSDWSPDGNYTIEGYTADIAALFESRGMKDVLLVGHSLGGRIALHYAARNGDRVKSVILADYGPNEDEATAIFVRKSIRSAYRPYKRLEDYIAILRDRYAFCDEKLLYQVADESTRKNADNNYTLKYDPAVINNPDIDQVPCSEEAWSLLSALGCQTLVMRGDFSSVLSAKTAQRMVERAIKEARLMTIPRAGHSVHLDNPAAVLKGIRQLLSRTTEPQKLF